MCPVEGQPEVQNDVGSSSADNPGDENSGGPGEALASPWDPTSEQAVVKARRRSKDPTPQEVLDHKASHEPYGEWCPACVAGSGRAESPGSDDHGQDALATLGIDYGYLNRRAGQRDVVETEEATDPAAKSSPVLCGRDSQDRWIIAHLLPVKGCGHPWCCKVLTEELKACGHRKLVFR